MIKHMYNYEINHKRRAWTHTMEFLPRIQEGFNEQVRGFNPKLIKEWQYPKTI